MSLESSFTKLYRLMLKNNLQIAGSEATFERWKNKYISNIILECMLSYGKIVGIHVVYTVSTRRVTNSTSNCMTHLFARNKSALQGINLLTVIFRESVKDIELLTITSIWWTISCGIIKHLITLEEKILKHEASY